MTMMMMNDFTEWLVTKHQSDCNGTQTHNQLVRKRNHLASLAKWLCICLRTKWFWVRVPFLSIKLQISPVSSKEFLGFQASTKCVLTLKRVSDVIRTYSQKQQNKVGNMFEYNNQHTRTMPQALLWCLYYQLRTYFTPYSSVSLNFKHVIAG